MTPVPTNDLHFAKPPIVEALLDLRVDPNPSTTLEQLESVHPLIADTFPLIQKRYEATARIEILKDSAPQIRDSEHQVVGYRFLSSDEKVIVQSRMDGYTYNYLRPYDTWQAFRDEARAHWRQYLEAAAPLRVKRIALRYINRILVPHPMRDFKDYFLITPEVAPELPQVLSDFLIKLTFLDPQSRARATVIKTVDSKYVAQHGTEKALPILFDIDVSFPHEIDPRSDDIWEDLETLRDFKNEIFSKSLTERCKELFR